MIWLKNRSKIRAAPQPAQQLYDLRGAALGERAYAYFCMRFPSRSRPSDAGSVPQGLVQSPYSVDFLTISSNLVLMSARIVLRALLRKCSTALVRVRSLDRLGETTAEIVRWSFPQCASLRPRLKCHRLRWHKKERSW